MGFMFANRYNAPQQLDLCGSDESTYLCKTKFQIKLIFTFPLLVVPIDT